MQSEAQANANFSQIRYAQCWEDADILLDGLNIQSGDVCVSIASAGDNVLAMAGRAPSRVIAIDLSTAQLACLALRVAAYHTLEHAELLELIGSRPSKNRSTLYQRCRPCLSAHDKAFWDSHSAEIDAGIGSAGKFERYFTLFRTKIMPLVHNRRTVDQLLLGGSQDACEEFYGQVWNTWRWRLLFKLFFSRTVMVRLGRDPSFFKYVEGSVAEKIFDHTRYALTALDPADNPYLQWILTGMHTTALPYALREENFDAIRANLDCLEWHHRPLEGFLQELGPNSVDRYNLSDIFEYMSTENFKSLLDLIARTGKGGGRLAYWNMLADRHRPDDLAHMLQPMPELSLALHARDKAFFYSDFVIEEIL